MAKLLVDSQISTGTRILLEALDKLGEHKLKLLVNTHWHFDHTDGNAEMHTEGAFIIAQDNTRVRLSKPQYMAVYDVHFTPRRMRRCRRRRFRIRRRCG